MSERYERGAAEARAAISSAPSRAVAAERIIGIADTLRAEDPLFLYREFFADIEVSDWEEFQAKESAHGTSEE